MRQVLRCDRVLASLMPVVKIFMKKACALFFQALAFIPAAPAWTQIRQWLG